MSNYRVNPNGLMDTGDELTLLTRQIEASVDNLNASVDKFLRQNTGQAPEEYLTAQKLWNAGISEMKGALANGVTRLNDIHAKYVEVDVRGANRFSSI